MFHAATNAWKSFSGRNFCTSSLMVNAPPWSEEIDGSKNQLTSEKNSLCDCCTHGVGAGVCVGDGSSVGVGLGVISTVGSGIANWVGIGDESGD